LELDIAILSRQGGRSYNEDACGHWNSDQHLVCVVADGAGGHGGGDIASKLAVQHVLERFVAHPSTGAQDMVQIVRSANQAILANQVPGTSQEHMHSTLVLLSIDFVHGRAAWAHAGDSRMYCFRQGQFLSRTKDHSFVQSLADAGLIAADQMKTHAQRSELLSALGSPEAELAVGTCPPDWRVQPGDVYLLCTDGLWEYVEDHHMAYLLGLSGGPQQWLEMLEHEVLRAAVAKPRHDNYSAIAVWTAP
jgi:serine/threonine protein phosphatase PrpC